MSSQDMPSTPPKSLSILLVEDTDAVRSVISRQLMMLGALVDAVPDGTAALKFAGRRNYDVVITDLRLPDMDGWHVMDNIRILEGYDTTPFVLMTADDVDTSKLDKYSSFLQKPVVMEDLGRLVEGQATTHHAPKRHYAQTGIDRQALKEQMGELDAGAIQMAMMFPGMMQPILNHVLDCAAKKDFKELVEAAHSLKGAARSVGAMHLGDLCQAVQQAAEVGKASAHDLQQLQQEFKRVELDLSHLV